MGTVHENRYTFLIISRSFLLKMRNVWDKNRRENRNAHFVFSYVGFFFFLLCHLWDIVEKCGRARWATDDDMVQWRTGVICMPGIYSESTVTHSESVIFTVFQWQQWLCEWPSLLHYTCIMCFLHCVSECICIIVQWNVLYSFINEICDGLDCVLSCTADTILFIYVCHIFSDNAIITACKALDNGIIVINPYPANVENTVSS